MDKNIICQAVVRAINKNEAENGEREENREYIIFTQARQGEAL